MPRLDGLHELKVFALCVVDDGDRGLGHGRQLCDLPGWFMPSSTTAIW